MGSQRPRWRARRQRLRGYARTGIAALVSLSIAGGATMLLGAAATTARADDATVVNGNATAQASVVRIAPGVGSLALATTTGTSLAHVANQLAEAQAQAADLGLIGSSLTAQQCDGRPGVLRADQLPKPLIVDNRKGAASASADEAPLGQSTLGGGRKSASADPTPAAHADVTDVVSSVGSTVTISGGRSDATTRVDPGKGREAESTVSVDIDIAGIVQLRGAQWHAFHRTGTDPQQYGTFSVASTTAGGVPLPIDQLGPLQDAINQALAQTGISISLPQVQRVTTPNDFIQVTPLRIALEDTPAGKATVGPVLNATRAQREQIINQVLSIACQLSGAALVADIGVDVVSGTGFTIIDIGGAFASSGETSYENPFGDAASLAGSGEDLALAQPGGAAPNPARDVPAQPPTARATPAVSPIASSGPLEAICETISPAKRPACSTGMGVPLALLAILVTGGFAYLDWRHQRRLRAAEAAS